MRKLLSLLSLPALLPAFLLSGCDGGELIACDTMLVFSVNLTVVDEGGAPIEGASARYRVDGGPEAACEDLGGGAFACGADEAGAFEITVEAEGREAEIVEAVVEAGECHVAPVSVEARLDQYVCGDAVLYGVQLGLAGASGEALEQPVAEWRESGGEWQSCEAGDTATDFLCAPNAWGSLEVRGSAAGHPAVSQAVEVLSDEAGCFPLVEEVEIVLDWGAD